MKMKVPGHKLSMMLAKSLLRDKRRISQCIQYWCTQEWFYKEDDFIHSFIHHMIHDPIQLHIGMDSIALFPNFNIPLRMLIKKELTALHALLQLHHTHKNPIFQSKVGMAGFQLQYERFKYDAVLDQRADRLAFVKQFILHSEAQLTFHEHFVAFQRIIHDTCKSIADHFDLKGHPLQKGLYHLSKKHKTCRRRSK